MHLPLKTLFFNPLRRHHLPLRLLHHRHLYPQPPPPPPTIEYPLTHPIYAIWAANTFLGKTLVSSGLSIAFLTSTSTIVNIPKKFVYLKPIQTGFPDDSDSLSVYSKFSKFFPRNRPEFSIFASNHVLNASGPAARALLGKRWESGGFGNGKVGNFGVGLRVWGAGACSELICKTVYRWREPISPHLAAGREGAALEDSELLEMLKRGMQNGVGKYGNKDVGAMCVIETAGGVASPGPSAILVGDGRLGGISGTISAYESLKLRGYDVVAVVFEDHGLVNEVPLSCYLQNGIPVFLLPPVPQDMSNDLTEWFKKSQTVFSSLKEIMLSAFHGRMQKLHDMWKRAHDIFWWPFTQHEIVPIENIIVIDSRCGEKFAVHKASSYDLITQQFDACASWWTQGPYINLQDPAYAVLPQHCLPSISKLDWEKD
ncbi:hypothetical protein ACH5RR_018286 [Cinchona calisaya]|uniref:Uncharacterized protein n=1 Tax=Cinchona calisaya TaxID=153742 RepID=A0ABD2ZL08_9GENT